jgi:hypothetical protein
VVLEMDNKTVVGFWRRLLKDVNEAKGIQGDLDFLANLVSYLMVFLPLRGWNLKEKVSGKHLDAMTRFILEGVGIKSPSIPLEL